MQMSESGREVGKSGVLKRQKIKKSREVGGQFIGHEYRPQAGVKVISEAVKIYYRIPPTVETVKYPFDIRTSILSVCKETGQVVPYARILFSGGRYGFISTSILVYPTMRCL